MRELMAALAFLGLLATLGTCAIEAQGRQPLQPSGTWFAIPVGARTCYVYEAPGTSWAPPAVAGGGCYLED